MSKYIRHEKSQRKHPVASSATSLIKAPMVPTAPKERPGWKGPGFNKKTPRQAQLPSQSKLSRVTVAVQEQIIPLAHQQLLLNVVRAAFPLCQDYETLKPMLQGIRLALAEGDSDKAFSSQDWMEAYAVRWSSTRALSCATLLLSIVEEFGEETRIQNYLDGRRTSESTTRIVCFGGGSTEIMAFAASLRHISEEQNNDNTSTRPAVTDGPSKAAVSPLSRVDLYLVDKADWAPVVSNIELGLFNPPELSKYASQSAKLNNASFIASADMSTSFLQKDILVASQEDLAAVLGPTPSLITFFFTLNDLHAISSAKTAALLLKLTLLAPRDSLLLVVDSVEPSSEAVVGVDGVGMEKGRYRMGKWLDIVLMGQFESAGVSDKSAWREIVRDENRVFRLAEGLKFPISLDHVNFQVHLFKKR
ncbi:hypothetical protein VTL71DRAFT_2330 [Oculimacula yallundae]|uniref:25S rRNA (Uridine(2843)-N(3))-methyltransferase n=1 Tax=Oculimacula yallundae TaxID=86028 RepID=A0ABR4CAK5_9HELO